MSALDLAEDSSAPNWYISEQEDDDRAFEKAALAKLTPIEDWQAIPSTF